MKLSRRDILKALGTLPFLHLSLKPAPPLPTISDVIQDVIDREGWSADYTVLPQEPIDDAVRHYHSHSGPNESVMDWAFLTQGDPVDYGDIAHNHDLS